MKLNSREIKYLIKILNNVHGEEHSSDDFVFTLQAKLDALFKLADREESDKHFGR